MKIVLFSGSLRTGSLNKKLVNVAHNLVGEVTGFETQIVEIKDFEIPVYNADVEASSFPLGVKKLAEIVAAAGALIISTPEYNGSMAGTFKNTIDWLSRVRPVPLTRKPVLLLGASPGALGAVRGLGNSRIPLEVLGTYVYPQVFGLPKAHEAFSESGDLKDADTTKKLRDLIGEFLQYAKKLTV